MPYTVNATLANGQRLGLTAMNNESAWVMAGEFVDQGAVYVSVAPAKVEPYQQSIGRALRVTDTHVSAFHNLPRAKDEPTEAQAREAIAAYRAQHPGMADMWEADASELEASIIDIEVTTMLDRFASDHPTMRNDPCVRVTRGSMIREMYAVMPAEYDRDQAYAYISRQLLS